MINIPTFKWQPGWGNQYASRSTGSTYAVPEYTIRLPSNYSIIDRRWKGIVFGQRIYDPSLTPSLPPTLVLPQIAEPSVIIIDQNIRRSQ
jgi:hypothetical protein